MYQVLTQTRNLRPHSGMMNALITLQLLRSLRTYHELKLVMMGGPSSLWRRDASRSTALPCGNPLFDYSIHKKKNTVHGDVRTTDGCHAMSGRSVEPSPWSVRTPGGHPFHKWPHLIISPLNMSLVDDACA
jgi:hypothetical protein